MRQGSPASYAATTRRTRSRAPSFGPRESWRSATSAVLATLPLVMLVQIGILVAVGVLIDTLLVRSIVVPALTMSRGSRIWWPSKLWRTGRDLVDDRG